MAKILVAEDDDAVRAFVRRGLEMDGHVVTTGADGADALAILEEQSGAFDLLLTDIKMPMMDGIALALAAAPRFPDLTIVLMTGYADQRERAYGLEALVHDVITKPFQLADMRTKVKEALASRKSPDHSGL